MFKRLVLLLCLIVPVSMIAEDMTIYTKYDRRSKMTSIIYYSGQYKLSKAIDHDPDRYDLSNNGGDELFDYVNSVKYYINHQKKAIKKYTLKDAIKYEEILAQTRMNEPEKFEKLDVTMKNFISVDGNLDKIAEYLIGDDDKPIVKKLGTKRVLKKKCDKWHVSLGNMSLEAIYDPTLILTEHQDAAGVSMLDDYLTTAFSKATKRLYKELRKLGVNGTSVKVQINFVIGTAKARVEQEFTKIVQGPIPVSVFELPEGYTIEEAGEKKLEELQRLLLDMST